MDAKRLHTMLVGLYARDEAKTRARKPDSAGSASVSQAFSAAASTVFSAATAAFSAFTETQTDTRMDTRSDTDTGTGAHTKQSFDCPVCTFINPASAYRCEMCDTLNPSPVSSFVASQNKNKNSSVKRMPCSYCSTLCLPSDRTCSACGGVRFFGMSGFLFVFVLCLVSLFTVFVC